MASVGLQRHRGKNGYWNVRTFYENGKLEQLIQNAGGYKILKKLEYQKLDGMNLEKSQEQKEISYTQERQKENIGMV